MRDSLHSCYIIDAVRSPIGACDGDMATIRPDDLLAQVLVGLLKRHEALPPKEVAELILGCGFPEGAQGQLMARAAALLTGLPAETCASVINRLDGSSLDAAISADSAIKLGNADILIACGVEHMGSVPEGGFNPGHHPGLRLQNYYLKQGETVEMLAAESSISRAAQEQYAISSHEKALEAWKKNRYAEEVIPIQIGDKYIDRDELPSYPNAEDYTLAPPAYLKNGSITQSTSASPAIGAAALLFASENAVKRFKLKPRAKIVASAVKGVHWEKSGTGCMPAVETALEKASLGINEICAIELHEAFAAQALYVLNKSRWPLDKTNQHGGSLAIGHPGGCTGGRLLSTLINVMEHKSLRYGVATTSISGGQGMAVILERTGE